MRVSATGTMTGRIMVVDESDLMQEFMGTFLEDFGQIIPAHSASEALRKLERNGPFDLVISSHLLADMNGVELLKRCAEMFPKTIRVLMSSSPAEVLEIKQALETGDIHRFVSKPFGVANLKKQLRHDLASRQKQLPRGSACTVTTPASKVSDTKLVMGGNR